MMVAAGTLGPPGTLADGATFSVLRSTDGAVAFSGRAGASLGSWSARFDHVFALDFDAVQAPGTYTVSLGGPAAASWPPGRDHLDPARA
jgi:hypothetical protein